VGLAASLSVSSLSSLITKSLLTSPQLPQLVDSNSRRLGRLYEILTSCLRTHGLEYFPASAGLFVFARLAPDVTSWEEEADMVRRLREAGVIVGPGRVYYTAEGDKGWVRLTFALPEDRLRQGLQGLLKGLGKV
jgi:DNA-binding transcriptional MocR family regulator